MGATRYMAVCGQTSWQIHGKSRSRCTFVDARGTALPPNRLTYSAKHVYYRGRKYKQERIVVASYGLRDKKNRESVVPCSANLSTAKENLHVLWRRPIDST
jgi:hypothetical protein